MRARGDFAGLAPVAADAADEGATATESVAACICRGLRRQFAIELLPSRTGVPARLILSCCLSRPGRQFHRERTTVGPRTQSTAKPGVPRSNRRQPLPNSAVPATHAR